MHRTLVEAENRLRVTLGFEDVCPHPVVLDVNDAATGLAPFTAIRYPTLLRAGVSHAQSRWIDDVSLFSR